MKTSNSLLLTLAIMATTTVAGFSEEAETSSKETGWQKAVVKMIQMDAAKISTTDQKRVDWVKQAAKEMRRECKVEKRSSNYVIQIAAPDHKQVATAN